MTRPPDIKIECPEWIGPPEPELWCKVEGYDNGVYKWAVATQDDIKWFANEHHARASFNKSQS